MMLTVTAADMLVEQDRNGIRVQQLWSAHRCSSIRLVSLRQPPTDPVAQAIVTELSKHSIPSHIDLFRGVRFVSSSLYIAT